MVSLLEFCLPICATIAVLPASVTILLWIYCRLTLGVCHSKAKLIGKTAIVTGATGGIGKETARDLAKRGARVILACRDLRRAQEVVDSIVQSTGNKQVFAKKLDLCSFDSVKKFAEDFKKSESKLHILVNNGAIGSQPFEKTDDGFEKIFQTNHLSHFLLTGLLLDLLKKSAPSRIVVVASDAHLTGWLRLHHVHPKMTSLPLPWYNNSKLANILFARELHRILAGSGVTVNSLHPGVVSTELFRNSTGILKLFVDFIYATIGKTPLEGAQTSIHLAVSEELENVSGKYFRDCHQVTPGFQVYTKGLQKRLWEVTEELVGFSYK